MYAIVDIETTGGSAKNERITEIAIYQHDGSKITDEFISLVNPERNIPYYITSLTGITNEMVNEAPRFFEIAKKIIEFTGGRIIVAHNAKFDYSFLRQEFSSLGYNFRRQVLDTVSLSRKLIPGYESYNLGSICRHIGIEINGRHRAAGDAMATARLFERLIEIDRELTGKSSRLISNTKISKLNSSLDTSKLDKTPEETGIYYFYNERGDLIYIGKSRNIKQRIATHLSNNTSERSMAIRDKIADFSWEITGSELIALIKESYEIKYNKPVYNKAQRNTDQRWGIYCFRDDKEYMNFSAGRIAGNDIPVAIFASKERARSRLAELVVKYGLCQKLTGLYNTSGPCFHYHVGVCRGACCGKEPAASYNERAKKASEEFVFSRKNYFIIDRGRSSDERSAVKIVNGRFTGYGYFNINEMGFGLTALHDCIMDCQDNRDIQLILKQYLRGYKVDRIIEF